MVLMWMYLPTIRVQYFFTQKQLNLQDKILLELLKDFDMSVLYHSGKASVVTDALSHMSRGSLAHVLDDKNELVKRFKDWLGWVFGWMIQQKEGLWFIITPNHIQWLR